MAELVANLVKLADLPLQFIPSILVDSFEMIPVGSHLGQVEFQVGNVFDVLVLPAVVVIHLPLQVQIHPLKVGHPFPQLLLPGFCLGQLNFQLLLLPLRHQQLVLSLLLLDPLVSVLLLQMLDPTLQGLNVLQLHLVPIHLASQHPYLLQLPYLLPQTAL